MAKLPKQTDHPSAQPSHPSNTTNRHHATKVQKRAPKKQRQAIKALQTTLHRIHAPHVAQHYRKEARRWVQVQKESQTIPGRVAQELFLFLKERQIGRPTKGAIDRENLSEAAEAAWARYLGILAGQAGDEDAVARNQAAVAAAKARIGEKGGNMGASVVDEKEDGEDGGVLLSPDPYDVGELVGELGALKGDPSASRTATWQDHLVVRGPKLHGPG